MYSSFQLAKKYVQYYATASNSRGHGVHSPFVFDFIIHVLNDKKSYDCYEKIEDLRRELLNNKSEIEVEDFGAGSSVIKNKTRAIDKIASSSLKPKKYAQLLYRIVKYYQPETMLELGTSFGITASYLASGNEHAKLYTLEGAESIANIAKEQFTKSALKNVELITGSFDKTLPLLFSSVKQIDLAFVDGNHRKIPTLEYFAQILNKSKSSSIIIFDDIHWSAEMEDTWATIQQHPSVTLSMDLFFIGLVFLDPDFKVKQQFKIRF